MHGTIKTRAAIEKAEEEKRKREYYAAHKAKLDSFLKQPQATEADKTARKDVRRTKELSLGLNVKNPFFDPDLFRELRISVAADGLPLWHRPRFDVYWFVTKVPQWSFQTIPDGMPPVIKPTKTRGDKITATWEGGNLADPVTKQPGVSLEKLRDKAAELVDFSVAFHKRWSAAASSYVDIRIANKVRRVIDETWRGGDETADYVSARPNKLRPDRDRLHVGRKCPMIFYEKPLLCIFLFWLMAMLRCDDAECWCADEPLRDFWLFAAETADEIDTPELHHAPGLARIFSEIKTALTLATWTSKEAKKRNRAKRPPARRPSFLPAHEELDLARRGKAGDVRARDEIIARHWPLVQRHCRHVPVADQADAIQAGMKRLLGVWNDWDHERGVRFGAFAAEPAENAIKDFMRQRRRQVPVAQSINANDPVADNPDILRAENNTMTNTEKRLSIAKLGLIAEHIGCLNPIQQRVMAQRLSLNGYQSIEQGQIADQLGMSERQIRRIEKAAVEKLQAEIFSPSDVRLCRERAYLPL
jgi:RNA polymerase sigma factor (sigma-70 family)